MSPRIRATGPIPIPFPPEQSRPRWVDVAAITGAVVLAALGAVSYLHLAGTARFLTDPGSAYLAYELGASATLSILFEFVYRCLRSAKDKPRYTKPKEPEEDFFITRTGQKLSTVRSLKTLTLPPFPTQTIKQATEAAFEFGKQTKGDGTFQNGATEVKLKSAPLLSAEVMATEGARCICKEITLRKTTAQLFAISDPPHAACDKLPQHVESYLKDKSIDDRSVSEALYRAFLEVNLEMMRNGAKPTSLCCALKIGDQVYVANVGSCRAMMHRDELAGFSLTQDTSVRLGVLEKPTTQGSLLAAVPQITKAPIFKSPGTIVLATPSFWERGSVADVHQALENGRKPQQLASAAARVGQPLALIAISTP